MSSSVQLPLDVISGYTISISITSDTATSTAAKTTPTITTLKARTKRITPTKTAAATTTKSKHHHLPNHYYHWYLVYHLIFSWLIISASATKEKACSSIDIRDVPEFKKLENCTVIEGSLQILLMPSNTSPRNHENITFPLLTEVTDYVLLFRGFGITNLYKLFPNLSVIRGQHLFHDFALIIFEMRDLQEIGLVNLTTIVKGAVRIERNRNLCFAETVNWDLIAKSGKGSNYVKDNKPFKECPRCSKSETNINCPVIRSGTEETSHGLCWNPENCQRICSNECESQNLTCNINNRNECCDKQCLGGCTGKTNKDCLVCKGLVIYENHEKICGKRCGPNQYEFLSRRCISFQDCLALGTPNGNGEKKTFKIFESGNNKITQCLSECPPGYQQSPEDEHKCDRCEGPCLKKCDGNKTITSAGAAQQFRGCTIVDGYLDISVPGGGNIITELEESLQQIRIIKGYLKIARSYPLITLHFFKNLQTIEGHILDRTNYSLVVIDNQNLQELFPMDETGNKSKVNVANGKIFFHINPRLCLSKIRGISRKLANEDEKDVSPYSNGDKTACELHNLNLTIYSASAKYAYLKWPNFLKQLTDPRSLLGYLVYYRDAPGNTTVSIYGGRDACYSSGWKALEVEADEERHRDETVEYLLTQLEPYTRYATYVKTYTIRTPTGTSRGGQSPIVYFQTKPTTPSQPLDLMATALSPYEIMLHWAPPKTPNGVVAYYHVRLIKTPANLEAHPEKDYCAEPLNFEAPMIPEEKINTSRWLEDNTTQRKGKEDETNGTECCSCKKPLVEYEVEAKGKMEFEDYLINHAYVKWGSPFKPEKMTREKRSIDLANELQALTDNPPIEDFLTTTFSPSTTERPEVIEYTALEHSIIINNLNHYTKYNIEVKACHNTTTDKPPEYELCSLTAITSISTLKKANADEIDSSSLHIEVNNVNNSQVAYVKWEEPSNPNGMILSYYLEYKTNEASMSDSTSRCITRREFQDSKGVIRISNLLGGKNYVLRVRAVTTAGKGNYTRYYEFDVPEDTYYLLIFAIALAGAFILLFSVSVAVFFRKKISGQPGRMIYASINPEYITHQPDEWEVSREDITLLGDLGQGSFGMVHLGELRSKDSDEPPIRCAIKTVNNQAMTKAFLNEAQVMKTFDCHHVVKLLGVVSTSQPAWVIMELMPNGDLRNYLLKQRPDNEDGLPTNPPTIQEIWRMSAEIADGMAYLGSRKFVHRDLAARNIMVAVDLTVKIGDFGMTRDIYETDYYRKDGQGLLPIRWMAPESIRDGIFTYCSDVWSYGIVLYEMATLGAQPYQGLGNKAVIDYITDGNIIERPKGCPDKLYKLMTSCWARAPKARPTFMEIIEQLLPDIDREKFFKVSFYDKAKSKSKVKPHPKKEVTCTTPLKSATTCTYSEDDHECSEHEIDMEEVDNGEDVQFFFSPVLEMGENGTEDESTVPITMPPLSEKNTSNGNISDAINKANIKNLGENGKGGVVGGGDVADIPLQPPDGNKESKMTSATSNGGLVNGPLPPHYNTTFC